jgi:hypothetical protein
MFLFERKVDEYGHFLPAKLIELFSISNELKDLLFLVKASRYQVIS